MPPRWFVRGGRALRLLIARAGAVGSGDVLDSDDHCRAHEGYRRPCAHKPEPDPVIELRPNRVREPKAPSCPARNNASAALVRAQWSVVLVPFGGHRVPAGEPGSWTGRSVAHTKIVGRPGPFLSFCLHQRFPPRPSSFGQAVMGAQRGDARRKVFLSAPTEGSRLFPRFLRKGSASSLGKDRWFVPRPSRQRQ